VYSAKVIQQNLEEFARREAWMPVYHTLDQVAEFKSYIDSITVKQSNSRTTQIALSSELTKRRADEIRRWIENEQVLCALDANYWMERYAYICNEKGEIFKFQLRKAQQIFASVVAEFDELGVAIELFVLKARQLGITTVVVMYFLHRLLFSPHTQAVMASVQADKSELIGRILEICLQYQPWWLIPRRTTDRIRMMGFDNGSVMSVQSGMQATGIAQGWTPTLVHVSEIGDIPNPEKVLEEGLFRATHPSRKLFAVYEGTGNGNTGWMADKWRSSKEDWPKGRARLCPLFINWPMAPDLYPQSDWIKKFPIPDGWEPRNETRRHVKRCEFYIRSNDHLSRICGTDWAMPREQQWFWEFNYDEAVQSHTEKVWMSQMPADDREALTGKNDLVFDPETIEVVTQGRKTEVQAYAITGETIDDGFDPFPEDIDYDKPRIRVTWKNRRKSGTEYDWTLVPLLPFDDTDERRCLDKVLIYEPPIAGYDYTMGIDTADGLGKEDEDRSVLSITHSVTGEDSDEQVAEMCSLRINSPQMVGFAACLAAWYGEKTRDPRGVKFCIEQRERPGDDCQLQLKFMGFNFHHKMIWYDRNKVQENASNMDGWHTTAWSRPLLMNRFMDAVKNGWYQPHSRWLIHELGNLERKFVRGRTRIEHQTGKKDDRALAAALSYFSRHHLDVLADRMQKKYALPKGKLPQINYAHADHNLMSVGE
jgi:hypothetical protein